MCTESSHGGDLMEPGHLVVALEAQRAAGVLGVNDVHKLGPENVYHVLFTPKITIRPKLYYCH